MTTANALTEMLRRFIAVSNKHLTGDDTTGELEATICDAEELMASIEEVV